MAVDALAEKGKGRAAALPAAAAAAADDDTKRYKGSRSREGGGARGDFPWSVKETRDASKKHDPAIRIGLGLFGR